MGRRIDLHAPAMAPLDLIVKLHTAGDDVPDWLLETAHRSGIEDWTVADYERNALSYDQDRHKRHHGAQTKAELREEICRSFRKWWRSING